MQKQATMIVGNPSQAQIRNTVLSSRSFPDISPVIPAIPATKSDTVANSNAPMHQTAQFSGKVLIANAMPVTDAIISATPGPGFATIAITSTPEASTVATIAITSTPEAATLATSTSVAAIVATTPMASTAITITSWLDLVIQDSLTDSLENTRDNRRLSYCAGITRVNRLSKRVHRKERQAQYEAQNRYCAPFPKFQHRVLPSFY
jgi:hypothetical protein